MKKLFSAVLCIVLAFAFVGVVYSETPEISSVAVYSRSSMSILGVDQIRGDGIIVSGKVSGSKNRWSTGSIYKTASTVYEKPSDINDSIIKEYTGQILSFSEFEINDFPGKSYFDEIDTEFNDGKDNLTVGWSSNEKPNGYTISQDSWIKNLEVKSGLTLNILTPDKGLRIIRVSKLTNYGTINITGNGSAIIFVDDVFDKSTGGTINATKSSFGNPDKLTIVFGDIDDVVIDNYYIAADIVAPDSDVKLNNAYFKGNIYTNGDFTMTSSAYVLGLVYAPFSETTLANSAYIHGMLYTNKLVLSGSSYVRSGEYTGINSMFTDFIGDLSLAQLGQSTPEPTATPTPTPEPTLEPTSEPTTEPTPEPTIDPSELVTITVTVARRMSIRLETGQILKNGDTFMMRKNSSIKFQICTNNWDTDTYTDDGQGIAGTKVYEYVHDAKSSDNYLRVDTNRYFMAVRFYFKNGNYNKQTGIDNVLSTPLESLSVNLPLGSTITADAYINYVKVDSAAVFVETTEDKTNCVTDYYWDR
ncbi:MAG TPA: hypothetical protein PLZ84_04935 [Clostridia bacterium]|nr:hypothetical protein [Clostridia bacterium]